MTNRVEYKDQNVLEAARDRVSLIFDEFENVVVSISGGKDSTVLFHLCYEEAVRRDRELGAFFLDQEAEYQATIDQIQHLMSMDGVEPYWYQVPYDMTNATSFDEYHLRAWGEGEDWMRKKDDLAIHSVDDDYPERFYPFMEWFEQQMPPNTAMMVGLRSKESMNRFRSVTKNSGYQDIPWTTETTGEETYRVYPIFDWRFGDVWKFISDKNLQYNKIYDYMYADDGINKRKMRVSNLIHEKSFQAIRNLRKYEPETFNKLTERLGGVHFASIYVNRENALSADKLPEAFDSWKEYRDYLLETTPTDKIDRFKERFEDQPNRKPVHKAQCKQMLINDWENNVSVTRKGIDESKEQVWRSRLEIK
ncbi:phosphoadenosine phosphosulfate reductase domain-containing protein [Halocatena halophila]|uniref:phosphoadenosine phosphosulfate reductase domain-containing protein n=1 Tax=Halocatena halophila TaxID=2814576 RepID=UPI002ED0173C